MLTIQFLCPLPTVCMLVRRGSLKNSAASGKGNHLHQPSPERKGRCQKLAGLIGTGTLFNDSCSLNISGSEKSRRGACWKSTSRCALSTAKHSADAGRTDGASAAAFIKPLNPDLLYGNVLASGVGVGTLPCYRATASTVIGPSRPVRKIHPAGAQPGNACRATEPAAAERDGESKTILSAHLSLIQDENLQAISVALWQNSIRGWGRHHQQYGAGLRQTICFCQRLSRERVSDIRDISEQLLHITWPN